jgi:hypothetical protein
MSETNKKEHISFSELSVWEKCHFKHKLKYLDNIRLDKPNEYTEFGHVIHEMLEQYLKTRVMPSVEDTKKELVECFTKHSIVVPNKEFLDVIEPISKEIPQFLEEKFRGWEFIDAESSLYENIAKHEGKFFKGFIDGIIRIPKSSRLKRCNPEELEYHLLDWKSCSWGWDLKKKTDPQKIRQLALYKHYWSEKLKIPLKEIRCGFVLLKRTPAKGKPRCELVSVSIGDKTIANGLKLIDNMLFSVEKRIFSKNRLDCKYCEYHKTKHCL